MGSSSHSMQTEDRLGCDQPFLLARHSKKAMTALAEYRMKLMKPHATTASQVLHKEAQSAGS
jgi:hypothetical protein